MRSARAVIGANFGDEGKGHLTAYYAAEHGGNALVVRSNGGANAGHTVVRPDKVRHVFHHFGSGALEGAATYLSRFFVSNPLLWDMERRPLELSKVRLHVDPFSPVTTHFDMLINQLVERKRGTGRHGSVGVGLNETVKRNEHSEFSLMVVSLRYPDMVMNHLHRIRERYIPRRLAELGIEPDEEFTAHVNNDGAIAAFARLAESYYDENDIVGIDVVRQAENVIFEGAQGLLLDEDHHFFPHVTHSHTGLRNVVALTEEAGIEHLDVTYVTRAYCTRHGAGPLPHERTDVSYPDPTNVPHPWQGTLRYADLDLDLLGESIRNDLAHADFLDVTSTLAITCLDQVGDDVVFWCNGTIQRRSPGHFVAAALEAANAPTGFVSYGPCRTDIRRF